MITLTMTEAEREALSALLETTIEDLREEIHETDRSHYKEMLQRQREILLLIRRKLQPELVQSV